MTEQDTPGRGSVVVTGFVILLVLFAATAVSVFGIYDTAWRIAGGDGPSAPAEPVVEYREDPTEAIMPTPFGPAYCLTERRRKGQSSTETRACFLIPEGAEIDPEWPWPGAEHLEDHE